MTKADKVNAVGTAVVGVATAVVAYFPNLSVVVMPVLVLTGWLFGWAAPQAGSSSKFTNVARDE